MDLKDLYRDVIVDHNRSPRNFRKIDPPRRIAEGFNPLCGDKLHVYLRMDGDVIEDIAFEGSGCAISVASASLMTETLKGKARDDGWSKNDAVKAGKKKKPATKSPALPATDDSVGSLGPGSGSPPAHRPANIPGSRGGESPDQVRGLALGGAGQLGATDWIDGGWDLPQSVAFCPTLKEMGCDVLQGYVFDRPLPIEQFEQAYGIADGRAAQALMASKQAQH